MPLKRRIIAILTQAFYSVRINIYQYSVFITILQVAFEHVCPDRPVL